MNKTKQITLLLLIVFLGLSLYSYEQEGMVHSLLTNDQAQIQETIQGYGLLAPLAFLIFVIIEVIIAPIPGGPIYIIAGILFHPLLGALIALIGNMIGAYIAFIIARFYGRNLVEKFITNKDLTTLDKFSKKHGALTLFLLRINPLTSTDLFSYLAGISKIKLKKFLIATALGLTPLIPLQSYLGNYIADSTILYNIFLLSSIIYLILAIIIILKIKK